MVASDINIQKVQHFSVTDSIDEISHRPAEEQTVTPEEERVFFGSAPIQVSQDNDYGQIGANKKISDKFR